MLGHMRSTAVSFLIHTVQSWEFNSSDYPEIMPLGQGEKDLIQSG